MRFRIKSVNMEKGKGADKELILFYETFYKPTLIIEFDLLDQQFLNKIKASRAFAGFKLSRRWEEFKLTVKNEIKLELKKIARFL
jgi:hypothetical protein